ncbi:MULTISPECIES: SspB family protein [Chelativorans]|jgi:hypothetical protein|uniref:Stringent starvation protein B n=1 Tax=Chelativorans sp. (strain BNC1) TaxID=266779 RepID=Q11GV0_CHESB|nr:MULTISPECIES: SspB family protein [Chelativorans]
MPEDRIRYDILVQEALRGVVRKVLQEVAQAGLPGNHHFFIRFVTNAPGVRISSRLKERYPEEMTIVIQYQYWDLKVTEKGFEVVLSFSDIPEKLEIPFSAVRGFYDPSASFEVEFEVKQEQPHAEPAEPTLLKEEAKQPAKRKPAAERKTEGNEAPAEEKAEGKGAEVVSLDAFRKK